MGQTCIIEILKAFQSSVNSLPIWQADARVSGITAGIGVSVDVA